ncbi:YCF48-related protein [Azospirillum sp. TSO22-1]|uniref:WD40/YVTN/BNR-like repeat-containing protein n=1 Tax=Azospirillum sp. TSO22-1 TaxID=716789 RepID=UPI000D609665|nr:YCF48-related protein [Azospirillum sp. TSO22-1]PWC30940.1 hypothetical protein TSO221_34155 [Azospirillum sp. TSO22-1]
MTISNTPPVGRRVALALLAVSLAALPKVARAGADLLQTPALMSGRAARSLLLGVARAGTRVVAVGERGIVVFSDDGGVSWRQAAVPVSVTLTAVHFPTPRFGWAVGHDGVVLHTADGGATWSRRFDGDMANTLVLADALERRDALAADPNADPAAHEAAELAVEDATAGGEFGPSRPLLGVWFRDEAYGIVVGSYGQVFRTRDGGRNWHALGRRTGNVEGLHVNAIAATPSDALLMAGEGGRVYRSADGGDGWEVFDLGTQAPLYGALALSDGDREALLAFGFGGRIYRQEDGAWWAVASPTGRTLVAGAIQGGTLTLVDSAGGTVVSTDGGRSFQAKTPPGAVPVTGMAAVGEGQWIFVGMGGARVVKTNGQS